MRDIMYILPLEIFVEIFFHCNLLLDTFFILQVPPPLTQQDDVQRLEVFDTNTPIFLFQTSSLPTNQIVFSFIHTPLPKELPPFSSSFLMVVLGRRYIDI
jgi:hypothetical protein